MPARIDPLDKISEDVRILQKSGKKVVFPNGCFDLLHAGHIDLLRQAHALGDVLVVAINTDGAVMRIKGPGRPILGEEERAELLAGLEMGDFVCTFYEDTPLEAILKIHPDVLVKGGDLGLDWIVCWGGVE